MAAGASTRLVQPKQLKVFKGKNLLQKIVDHLNVYDKYIKVLVLGANSQPILENIQTRDFIVAVNKNWELGISQSIKIGLKQALLIEPALDHIMVFLTDQPFVSNKLIDELIVTHLKGEKPITASFYDGKKGVPAIFSRSMFKELKNLSGDSGAGKMICKYDANAVNFEKGMIDIDTPEDYRELKMR